MRSYKPFLIVSLFIVNLCAAAFAAKVDFKDPRRALGREDDIRVDAELSQDTLTPNSTIAITYQIENLSKSPIAIADKVSDLSFDPDSATVTLSVGSEVPPRNLPHLTIVDVGQKRVLTAGALVHVLVPSVHTQWTAVPRFVQIKVTVLKDVAAFARLMEQAKSASSVPLPNDLFDRWVNGSLSIFLNTIPVYWNAPRPAHGTAENASADNP